MPESKSVLDSRFMNKEGFGFEAPSCTDSLVESMRSFTRGDFAELRFEIGSDATEF